LSLLFYILFILSLYVYILEISFVSKPIIAYESDVEKRLKFNINKRYEHQKIVVVETPKTKYFPTNLTASAETHKSNEKYFMSKNKE
jgi:hypothetical protein